MCLCLCKIDLTFIPARYYHTCKTVPDGFGKHLICAVIVTARTASWWDPWSRVTASCSEWVLLVPLASAQIFLFTDAIHLVPPFSHDPACGCVVKSSPRWLLRGFPIRTSQMCQGCTCSKRNWEGGRLHPPVRARQAPGVPIQRPGSQVVHYLFKATIVLCLGWVNLLWFRTVEPAVCNLM